MPEEATRQPGEASMTLVMGDAGNGKSTSIATQLKSKHIERVFVIGTEPRFLESITLGAKIHGVEDQLHRLHYAHVYPMNPTWADMDKLFSGITSRNYQGVASATYDRTGYDHILDFISLCGNFKDQHGKEWGPIDEFDDHQFLNIDSLTGLSRLAKDAAVGPKPVIAQGEWNVAQAGVEVTLSKLAHSCRCFVNIVGHLDRIKDEVLGGTHVTALTLGQKLTPKLIPYFSEIICAVRDKDKFFWSTTEAQHTLKARALPFRADLEPDFGPIIDAHFA